MRRLLFLLVTVVLTASPSAGRELHWRELAVRAELDAEGRLLVQERHAMVFDGAWNGGERSFRLRTGQRLDFHSIDRIDPELGPVALQRGDLDLVDRWDWSSSNVLRWRSRLPSDPPFENTEIVYTLTYALSNILVRREGGYMLDHDFAFSDRFGVIENFVLDLELAPEWTTALPFEGRHEITGLQPGLGAPVTLFLEHSGGRPLAGVVDPLDASWRHAAFAATLAGFAAMFFPFWRRENGLGRFEPDDAPVAPSPAWIEEHVLSWLPEQAGALWDEKVGPPEVAAVIARWVAEGKVTSTVERRGRFFKRHVLTLERHVQVAELSGYERVLAGKLFFSGRERVSTDQLRKHYKRKGFNPAATIRSQLERSLEKRSRSTGPEKPSAKRTLYLFGGAAAAGVLAFALRREETIQWALLAFAAWVVLYLLGLWGALRWRRKVFDLTPRMLWFLLPLLALAAAYWLLPTIFGAGYEVVAPRQLGLLALALVALGSASSLFNQAAARSPAKRLRLRRRLHVVREWWKDELDREAPALSDDLFPYLIAFGLQRRVDRWFERFGERAKASRVDPSVAGQGSGGGSHWTGGGGSFGGAGATTAWTAAATGMASGVTAASSGSGSGGGGGSSSGGGGGGGW